VLLRVRRRARAEARDQASLAADSVQRPPGMSRGEWRPLLRKRREAWRTPPLDTLPRPELSTARRIGLLTLRGYIVFAIVIVVLKLVQVTAGH
jgi:hypothetical protein